MSKILIDPETLRGGSRTADGISAELERVGSWSAPAPQGITGATTEAIASAQRKTKHVAFAGRNQAIYLRTTAMIAIAADSGCAGNLHIDPQLLAPLSDPFGRDKPRTTMQENRLREIRHALGAAKGFGSGATDTAKALALLARDLVKGDVKIDPKSFKGGPQGVINKLLAVTIQSSVSSVSERDSKERGAEAAGRLGWELLGWITAYSKALTAPGAAAKASRAGQVARAIDKADRVAGPLDVRTHAAKVVKGLVEKRKTETATTVERTQERIRHLEDKPTYGMPRSEKDYLEDKLQRLRSDLVKQEQARDHAAKSSNDFDARAAQAVIASDIAKAQRAFPKQPGCELPPAPKAPVGAGRR